MRFSNVRLLVKDFAKCFKFYTEQLGLEPSWGDENSGYANFKVADGIEGFTLEPKCKIYYPDNQIRNNGNSMD